MELPKLNLSRVNRNPEKILLIAYYDSRSVPSIVENIQYLQHSSTFAISVLNLFEHRPDAGYLKIPSFIKLDYFDAIVIHNTVAYSIENLRSLDEVTSIKLRDYAGTKVIFKQDEHFRFADFVAYAQDIKVDCIFSVMPAKEIESTYGNLLADVNVKHMLTGYVTQKMRCPLDLMKKRPIDIGYRGSIMPLSFGRLCYQKRQIGDDVGRLLKGRGFAINISSLWEDRLGAEAWTEFLRSCKAVLGVESGTDIFDLDGRLQNICHIIEEEIGSDDGTATYAESYLAALQPYENQVYYRTISPRHFEAAATGTLQILFPGEYSGLLTAGRHFFELKHDYSNLSEALDLINDDERRNQIVTAAFEEVILNKKNWIETFVKHFDDTLSIELDKKGLQRRPVYTSKQPSHNVLTIQAHHFGADPRRDNWYASHAPDGIKIHQLGVDGNLAKPFRHRKIRDEIILDVPSRSWTTGALDCFIEQISENLDARSAFQELYFISYLLTLSDRELLQAYGVIQKESEISTFRWYLKYLLDTANTLVHSACDFKGIHCIVAINFPAVIPALILKGILNIPVIYEALEYWPEADPDHGEFLTRFWLDIERRLIRFTDHRGTVSPPLAELMAEAFGVPFYAVPNCSPLAESIAKGSTSRLQFDATIPVPVKTEQSSSRHWTWHPSLNRVDKTAEAYIVNPQTGDAGHKIRFLFQGNFAPHRGLEELLRAWPSIDPRAILVLRGPDQDYKRQIVGLARELGLGEDRVVFPEPVPPTMLVEAARLTADVGIVPYSAVGTNYSNCSPNKLGQYLAAGLPILANDTTFVSQIVREAQCGIVANFSKPEDLKSAVSKLCDAEFRQARAINASAFFSRTYNWESVSGPFYDAVRQAVSSFEPEALFFFDDRQGLSPVQLDAIYPSKRKMLDDIMSRRVYFSSSSAGPPSGASVRSINHFVSILSREISRCGTADLKDVIAKALIDSELFFEEYYLAANRDVREAEIDPCLHYFEYGAAEGRQPFAT